VDLPVRVGIVWPSRLLAASRRLTA